MSPIRFLRIYGIELTKLIGASFLLPKYYYHLAKFKKQIWKQDAVERIRFARSKPEIYDWRKRGGVARGPYFHQDLYVAQEIYKAKPIKHVDIGSRVDGFVAHVASFREIEVFDIRENTSTASNIVFKQSNLMDLEDKYHSYTKSLSCLHVVEHLGLGRYGDPIDVNGHKKGLDNLYKMLQEDGILYFSVPIGPLRVEFNSQRVFSLEYLNSLFEGKFDIGDFSYVDDKGDIHRNIVLDSEKLENNCGCYYGCGIFQLAKL